MNLLYTDAALDFDRAADVIGRYADELRDAAYRALNEEAILVAVYPVFHSE